MEVGNDNPLFFTHNANQELGFYLTTKDAKYYAKEPQRKKLYKLMNFFNTVISNVHMVEIITYLKLSVYNGLIRYSPSFERWS